MTDLTLTGRMKRLAEYIRTIAGDASEESVETEIAHDTSGLESVPGRTLDLALKGVRKSLAGETATAEELFAGEAIIHLTKRPSHLVLNDWFQAFTGDFRYLTLEPEVKQHLKKAIPAVGRINLTAQTSTYAGTGFVVGENLVMTNRHVAEQFTTGAGVQHLVIDPPGASDIDFKREYGSQPQGFPLTQCLMIHPYWDMALFRVDLPGTIEPLEMSVASQEELLGRDVVVVGYPAFDPRNEPDAQRRIFDGIFNVKRIAPGRVRRRKEAIGSKWLSQPVEALAHDSSTLGGNSGSAVINVQTGQVVGLHFAGRFLVENYAVPGNELASDPRVVDAGVRFARPLPPASDRLDRYWNTAGSPPVSPAPGFSSLQQTDKGTSMTTHQQFNTVVQGPQGVSFQVPLTLTLSLGAPGDASAPAPAPASGEAEPGFAQESIGGGYDAGFLSEAAPVPGLSAELREDSVEVSGSPLIHYTHFSVCQSKKRRLPRFVAWNIDGASIKKLSRRGIEFRTDPQIPEAFQADNSLYKNNPYDRGHIARRADLTWGPLAEAKQANRDSFFFTNITPQHQNFNQAGREGLWGELEDAIMEDIEVTALRVSVMAGPVFKPDDPPHRAVRIPRDYWKLIAFTDDDDQQFKVAAYLLTQSELVDAEAETEALALEAFRLHQVPLDSLGEITGLDFAALHPFDTFGSTGDSHETPGALHGDVGREIGSRAQITAF